MSRRVLILRESLLAGPLAAMLVAVPTVLVEGGASIERWLVISVILVVPLAAFIAAARLARRSLATLLPDSRRTLFVGVSLWVLLSFPLLAALGLVLKATTHHRGLGGATFGALALGASLGAAVLAWRLSAALARRSGVVGGMLNVCLAVATVGIAVISARAALSASSGWLPGGLVAVIATVLAARWDAPRKPHPDSQEPI
jgi:hypothetical protein